MNPAAELVYFNGHILPVGEARVSVFDAGFSHAAGLFETMRSYRGRVLRLERHLDRLLASARALQMQIPVTARSLEQAVYQVLEANELPDARLRLTVTPGIVPRPGEPVPEEASPTVLVSATPVRPHPPELYLHGMRVCLCPHRQSRHDALAGHKTLAYLPRLLAMKHAAEMKCHESLWFNTENQLAEASIANVFVVREGVLRTPPLDTPILPGTTRQTVLELAAANGLTVAEEAIDIGGLLSGAEVFLTGSVLEIMPVTAIEKHQVGDGLPGPVTRRLRELYVELVQRECG